MENIEQMRIRHKNEIGKLQKYCNHPTSTWMEYMWAPGHFLGQVKVCDFCGKPLERNTQLPNVMQTGCMGHDGAK